MSGAPPRAGNAGTSDPGGRYALYFAPEPDDPWWEVGTSWLGSDPVTGERRPPPLLDGLLHKEWERITAAPRFYGWHATLKPPFALASAHSEADLIKRARAFCAQRSSFDLPGLAVRPLGDFLALRPAKPVPALDVLAADCVKDFDALRRPMDSEELARRESADLNPQQRALLYAWGYPYVFDQFRFHLSLTGRLDPGRLTSLGAALSDRWASLTSRAVSVTGLCIFHQPARTEPFRLRWRVRWGRQVETLAEAAR